MRRSRHDRTESRFHPRADRSHEIKAVLVTHNETATGVKSDVGAVRRAIDACDHPAMLFADCVSSLASMDFRMDEWGVDVAVAGSQKGFMPATGMAIGGVSPKAIEAAATAACPRAFLDFGEMLAANAAGGFPYTPSLQLLYGLRASLDMLFEEGLDNVFARHRRIRPRFLPVETARFAVRCVAARGVGALSG